MTNLEYATLLKNMPNFYSNIIEDIKFEGEACVISISSTNILANMLIGKTKDDGIYIKKKY